MSDPYEAPENPCLKIETGEQSLEFCTNQVADMLVSKGVIKDNREKRVTPSLVSPMTIEEKDEFEGLEVLDIDVEQVQYLQTIGEGWAFPLKRFMNELELLEVMHMNTLIDQETGEKHLLSVPIT